MRFPTSIAIATCLLSGCFTSTRANVAGGVAVASLAASAATFMDACWPPEDDYVCDTTASTTLLVVAGVAAVAAIALETSDRPLATPGPPSEPIRPEVTAREVVPMVPLQAAIAARDPLAAQLTLQAHRAAARGDCASIPLVGSRVLSLDPAYHAQVFAVDPAIARCL